MVGAETWERSEVSRNAGVLEQSTDTGHSASELTVQNPDYSRFSGTVTGRRLQVEQAAWWNGGVAWSQQQAGESAIAGQRQQR